MMFLTSAFLCDKRAGLRSDGFRLQQSIVFLHSFHHICPMTRFLGQEYKSVCCQTFYPILFPRNWWRQILSKSFTQSYLGNLFIIFLFQKWRRPKTLVDSSRDLRTLPDTKFWLPGTWNYSASRGIEGILSAGGAPVGQIRFSWASKAF